MTEDRGVPKKRGPVTIATFASVVNPFSPAKAPNLAELCNPTTRQAIELDSYPNHPRIQQVL